MRRDAQDCVIPFTPYVPYMFSSFFLHEAFALAADPADWSEFNQLRPPDDTDLWIVTLGDRWNERDIQVLRYRELWAKFVELLREKLMTGEWTADGFNAQLSSEPVTIPARLWKVLDVRPGHDEAEGEGFKFISLSFSQVKPSRKITPHAEQPSLRRQLTKWIRDEAERAGPPTLRKDQYAAACKAFAGLTITDNMFTECRRAAGLKRSAIQRGRPKAKGSGN
jgi:hypothetical protein